MIDDDEDEVEDASYKSDPEIEQFLDQYFSDKPFTVFEAISLFRSLNDPDHLDDCVYETEAFRRIADMVSFRQDEQGPVYVPADPETKGWPIFRHRDLATDEQLEKLAENLEAEAEIYLDQAEAIIEFVETRRRARLKIVPNP